MRRHLLVDLAEHAARQAVAGAGYNFDVGVAAELFQRVAQLEERQFEIEGVFVATEEVQLALELGAEGRPGALDDVANVVLEPGLADLDIQLACLAVPDVERAAVGAARAEGRVGRCTSNWAKS